MKTIYILLILSLFASCRKKKDDPKPVQSKQQVVVETPQWPRLKEKQSESGSSYVRSTFVKKDGTKDVYLVEMFWTESDIRHKKADVTIDWSSGSPVSNYFLFKQATGGYLKSRPQSEQLVDYGGSTTYWILY